MDGLVQTIRGRVFTFLQVLLTAGFIMVVLELVLTGHTEGTQLVGVIASLLGAVLVGGALFVSAKVRMWIAGALVVLSLSGLTGVAQHFSFGPGAPAGEANENVPPLAPLSLAGLALMSAVVLVGRPVPAEPVRRKRTR
jgi:hypothetical protein